MNGGCELAMTMRRRDERDDFSVLAWLFGLFSLLLCLFNTRLCCLLSAGVEEFWSGICPGDAVSMAVPSSASMDRKNRADG